MLLGNLVIISLIALADEIVFMPFLGIKGFCRIHGNRSLVSLKVGFEEIYPYPEFV